MEEKKNICMHNDHHVNDIYFFFFLYNIDQAYCLVTIPVFDILNIRVPLKICFYRLMGCTKHFQCSFKIFKMCCL